MNKAEILAEVIRNRRSVFPESFIDKEISKEIITQILESANYAPTHKLTQPWRFTVIRGEAKKRLGETMAEMYKSQTKPEQFLQKKYDSFAQKTQKPGIILAINIAVSGAVPEWEELVSTACSVQNMALMAETLQVGGYWSTPPMITDLGAFLGLSPNEKCIGLFYMGYHEAEPSEARRSPMSEKITWLEA